MKELKDRAIAAIHGAFEWLVESGEGIERQIAQSLAHDSFVITWNPVKELKVVNIFVNQPKSNTSVESGEGIER